MLVGIYTKWLGAGGALTNAGQAINSHAIHTTIYPHSCLNQRPMSVTVIVGVLCSPEQRSATPSHAHTAIAAPARAKPGLTI